MNDRVTLHNVYYEMKIIGQYLRVAAIDPITGMEAYSVGPRKFGERMLQHNAKKKLEYILTKKRREEKSRRSKNRNDWIA